MARSSNQVAIISAIICYPRETHRGRLHHATGSILRPSDGPARLPGLPAAAPVALNAQQELSTTATLALRLTVDAFNALTLRSRLPQEFANFPWWRWESRRIVADFALLHGVSFAWSPIVQWRVCEGEFRGVTVCGCDRCCGSMLWFEHWKSLLVAEEG